MVVVLGAPFRRAGRVERSRLSDGFRLPCSCSKKPSVSACHSLAVWVNCNPCFRYLKDIENLPKLDIMEQAASELAGHERRQVLLALQEALDANGITQGLASLIEQGHIERQYCKHSKLAIFTYKGRVIMQCLAVWPKDEFLDRSAHPYKIQGRQIHYTIITPK